MAHLQLTAVADGRDYEMDEVALLGSYDEEAAGEAEEEAGMRRVQVRVTGMTCSACTGAIEATVSARRGVRRASVSLLQSRAHVVFDPALAKPRKWEHSGYHWRRVVESVQAGEELPHWGNPSPDWQLLCPCITGSCTEQSKRSDSSNNTQSQV